MGRELQKRKKRSSRAKVQTHTIKKKHLNPQGSGIVAKAWLVPVSSFFRQIIQETQY